MKSKKVDPAKLAKTASHDAARMKQMGEATGSRNSPHLIADGTLQRCSGCKMPFLVESKESLNVTFAKHVLSAPPARPSARGLQPGGISGGQGRNRQSLTKSLTCKAAS